MSNEARRDSAPQRAFPRKLQQPQMLGDRFERVELLAALDEVFGRQVALVCAPAGFGKTWLVLEWLHAHRATDQAWVSLDELDNDEKRLATHVGEALRGAMSDPGIAVTIDHGFGGDVDDVVDRIIHAVERWGRDVILALDDAHLIQSPAAVELLTRIIATAPSNLQLVLIGRHEPMPQLGRLRLAGELVEIRTDDLRLSLDEATKIVELTFEAPVSDATVEEFRVRTGGWMAAFRLAALAVGSASDPNDALAALGGGEAIFAEYEVIFAEYVVPEILDEIEPELRDFMLETSLLDELCPESCAAITGRDGSDVMLARIAGEGAFSLEIDKGAGCYRHHDFFREVLRAELGRGNPERLHELHRRAGEWSHDHGDPEGAILHMLAADRPDIASDWYVAESGQFLARGQTATLATLGSAFTRPGHGPPLPVLGTIVSAAVAANQPAAADELLAEFEQRIVSEAVASAASDPMWDWPGFVYPFHRDPAELLGLVRATIAYRAGDFQAIIEQAAHLPSESGALEGILGRVYALLERYSEAEEMLRTFVEIQAASQHSAPHTRARATGSLALAWAGAGQLTEADELAGLADVDVRTNSRDRVLPAPEVSLALAEVAWERGELDTALEHVATALIRSSDLREVVGSSLAVILKCRVRGSRGDRFGAEAELRQAIGQQDRLVPHYFEERIAFERATLALQDDDFLGAELAVPDWRERVARGATTMREQLLDIRFVIADGQDPTALLEALPHGCEVTVTHRIQLGLLRSLAAVAAGNDRAAIDELAELLQLAAHSGHRQRFLDERAVLGTVIEAAAARNGVRFFTDGDFRADNVASGATERTDLRDAKSLAEHLVVFVEPLTFRELEVLRLLPSHRSYREIGAELYVSVNTVKYHVKAIYRKLGAEGRADAVQIAQRTGMLTTSA